MNETPNSPPVIPPPLSGTANNPEGMPLGHNPDDKIPIPNLIAAIEAILRQPRRVMFQIGQPNQTRLTAGLLVIAVFCSVIYGVVVGTFSGGEQLWAAPAKIAGGLLVSAFICLPSLYIFSCLSGSQARLAEVFGLLAALLALMTVLLIGFAPVAWVFSQSTESVAAMGALHIVFWLIATYFGLRFLFRAFAHLKGKSNGGLVIWTFIFLLVALQMTTALRPIVGTAPTVFPTEKKFFLSYWADSLDHPSEKNSRPHRHDYD